MEGAPDYARDIAVKDEDNKRLRGLLKKMWEWRCTMDRIDFLELANEVQKEIGL